MDGKPISSANVYALQDIHGYYGNVDFIRLWQGKHVGLYMHLSVIYAAAINQPNKLHANLYLGKGDVGLSYIGEELSYKLFKEFLKDCPLALERFHKEFNNTVWSKTPIMDLDDFRGVIRVLQIYNDNCQ